MDFAIGYALCLFTVVQVATVAILYGLYKLVKLLVLWMISREEKE